MSFLCRPRLNRTVKLQVFREFVATQIQHIFRHILNRIKRNSFPEEPNRYHFRKLPYFCVPVGIAPDLNLWEMRWFYRNQNDISIPSCEFNESPVDYSNPKLVLMNFYEDIILYRLDANAPYYVIFPCVYWTVTPVSFTTHREGKYEEYVKLDSIDYVRTDTITKIRTIQVHQLGIIDVVVTNPHAGKIVDEVRSRIVGGMQFRDSIVITLDVQQMFDKVWSMGRRNHANSASKEKYVRSWLEPIQPTNLESIEPLEATCITIKPGIQYRLEKIKETGSSDCPFWKRVLAKILENIDTRGPNTIPFFCRVVEYMPATGMIHQREIIANEHTTFLHFSDPKQAYCAVTDYYKILLAKTIREHARMRNYATKKARERFSEFVQSVIDRISEIT